MALGTFLDVICQVFNGQAIPRLIDLNSTAFQGITDYPTLIHGDLESQNLSDLGAFVKDMASCGALTLDGDLESHLRRMADLPEKDEGYGMY